MFWRLLIIIYLGFSLLNCKGLINNEKPEKENNVKYSFFVAGHTYGKPGVNNVGFHPPFKEKMDFLRNDNFIKFGIFTGDLVHSSTKENWNEIDEDIAKIGKPTYFAFGNHDTEDRKLIENRYGEVYRSFYFESDLFIILDPKLDKWNISGEQLDFLKETLKTNTSKVNNIFVFFHEVLWWSANNKYKNVDLNSFDYRADSINFWTEVEPLFNLLPNNTFMFAGDVGAYYTADEYMYDHYDNITLIASGMGGEVRDNFVVVEVTSDRVQFKLIALNEASKNTLGKLEDYILEK